MSDAAAFFCGMFVGVVVMTGSVLFFNPSDAVRRQAIEAGVAHWTIDAKTGERKFEWIKPEGKE